MEKPEETTRPSEADGVHRHSKVITGFRTLDDTLHWRYTTRNLYPHEDESIEVRFFVLLKRTPAPVEVDALKLLLKQMEHNRSAWLSNIGTTDPFPAPAPAGAISPALSAFNGISPNGTWSLYVVDDVGGDVGSITGGWSLSVITADPFCVTSPCVLNVPADITQANDPSVCGAIVNWTAGVTSGSCGVVTSAPPSGSFFAVGTTPVVVTGTRQDNSTTTAGFSVTVNDVEQPTISNASADPSSLWPPNHKMVNVAISYDVADNCTLLSGIVTALSVTSNEPVNGTGDGDTSPDWEVIDSHHLRLRAERAGGGSGRIYTITITARDAAGNVATRVVTVTVPHDLGN